MSVIVKSTFTQIRQTAIAILLMQPFVMSGAAFAQSIVPTQGVGNLGTQVAPDVTNAQQLNITGGTQAAANLYHSFQQFGLTQGEIANFMSNPSIQNILARVSGGNASVINGLIQVSSGNSNLYLLNPAGIIFGANSSLNVPAAFTATTASGIQVGNGWFGMNTGIDDVKKLTGTPQAFGFASSTVMPASEQPVAAIANAGNLTAKEGQSITLVGGLVINTGTITTPSGKITIAAVPDGKYVKITPEGSLLSLQLAIADQNVLAQSNVQAKDLPNLLTGSANLRNMTGLNADASGNVLVAGTAIPNTAGTAIASGNLDVSSTTAKGGEINVLGDRVGLVSANLNASGAIGGGTVLIGGDLQGKGTVPNAQFIYVSPDSTIIADALHNGNGGLVVAWSDRATRFFGSITAKGGTNSGDGGFVEVSGKNGLDFQGSVNTQAPNGKTGTLLLDPYNLVIDAVGGISLVQAQTLGFGADFTTSTLGVGLINGAAAGTTISLQARNNITFNASIINFNDNVNLIANAGNTITLVNGVDIRLGGGNTNVTFTAGGNIVIASQGTGFFDSAIRAGSVSLSSTNGNINTGTIKTENGDTGNANISLSAFNGTITLDGFLQAGNVGNGGAATPLADSKITITAQSFRAINPLVNNGNYIKNGDITDFASNGQANPISLIAYSAATVDNFGVPFTGVPTRSIQLTLPGDTSARTIAGSGAPIISINILKDTTFSIYPRAILSGTSGTNGAISQGVSSIPPNVLVLLSDQSFSSNAGLANTLAADTLNSDAIASARSADLQANAGKVQECEPTGTKKPILNVTASVPSTTVTRTVQSSNRSNLPPCKE